jgi:hypothetical protein
LSDPGRLSGNDIEKLKESIRELYAKQIIGEVEMGLSLRERAKQRTD